MEGTSRLTHAPAEGRCAGSAGTAQGTGARGARNSQFFEIEDFTVYLIRPAVEGQRRQPPALHPVFLRLLARPGSVQGPEQVSAPAPVGQLRGRGAPPHRCSHPWARPGGRRADPRCWRGRGTGAPPLQEGRAGANEAWDSAAGWLTLLHCGGSHAICWLLLLLSSGAVTLRPKTAL